MNKKNLFKLNEGAVLFAFGFCLEDKPVVSLLFCIMGIGIVMLFPIHRNEVKKTIILTVPFLIMFALTGLLSKRPALAACLIVNAMVSEFWKTSQPEVCDEEKVVYLLCLSGFVLLSFFIKDLFFGMINTILISMAVFGMPLSVWVLPSLKHQKKDRKRNGHVLQSMA